MVIRYAPERQYFNVVTDEIGELEFWCPNYAVVLVDGRTRTIHPAVFRDEWTLCPDRRIDE